VVLAGPRHVVRTQGPAAALLGAMLQQHLAQPVANPGFVEKPGVFDDRRYERELLLTLAVLVAQPEVRPILDAWDQRRIERQGQPIHVFGARPDLFRDAQTSPVAGAAIVQ